jgi:outer membrane protein TolC
LEKIYATARAALGSLAFVLVFCGLARAGGTSGDIPAGEPLTITRCIEIALERHPSLREARSSIESQSARVGEAAASARPQVRVSSSYGRSYSGSGPESGSINTDITLSQTLFDWDRTSLSVKGALLELEARRYDESGSEMDVIRDVISAYFSVNRSERTLGIAMERLDNYEKRLRWAKDFYEVGTKARIEVTKAETDLANAKLDLVSARGALQKANASLAHAMGVTDIEPGRVPDILEVGFVDPGVGLDEAVETAVRNREDYLAQSVRIDASEASLELARKGMKPTVTGSAGYTLSGENDPVENRDLRLSVGLSIPVADGGQTAARTRQAEADLEGARARGESLRQNIVMQVRTAHASLEEARESVSAAREAARQALETLKLAQGRYAAGVGSSLEISDAVDGYASAQMSVATALYNENTAEAELIRAIGGSFQ